MNRSAGSDKFDSNNADIAKISNLGREVDGLITSQKAMQSELHKLDQNINEIKHVKTVTVDPRIKRLEEQIDSLAKLIEDAKLYNVNHGASVGFDTTANTFDKYKFDTLPQPQTYITSNQPYSLNRNITPLQGDALTSDLTNLKYSDYLNKNQHQPWNPVSHSLANASVDKVCIDTCS